jgi:hypothetical protein
VITAKILSSVRSYGLVIGSAIQIESAKIRALGDGVIQIESHWKMRGRRRNLSAESFD